MLTLMIKVEQQKRRQLVKNDVAFSAAVGLLQKPTPDSLKGDGPGNRDSATGVTSIERSVEDASTNIGNGVAASIAAISIVRNVRLQYLRAVAATAVMLMHASECLLQFRGDGRFSLVFTHFFGAYGVAIFFALSGALMSHLIQRGSPFRFMLDRIVRIYPPMLFVVVVTALAFLVTGFKRTPELITLTLIPIGPREYYLGNVEWTLIFEMSYYAALTLLVLAGLRRFAEGAALLWLALLVGLDFAGHNSVSIQTPTITQLPLQSANVAFLMGFLLPRLNRRGAAPPASVVLAVAVILTILAFLLYRGDQQWLTTFAAVMLVFAALQRPAAAPDGFAGRLAVHLGDVSYILYLVHIPVILVSANLLSRSIPAVAVWLGWVIGSLALACAIGSVDRRVHARLKGWVRRLPHKRTAIVVWTFLALFLALAAWADATTRVLEGEARKAREGLAERVAMAVPKDVLARVENADRLPDGRIVVRGHAIDLAAPAGDAHVAILQGGRVVGFDRVRRMRPAIAKAAGRPDLEKIRFGFSISTLPGFDCASGALDVRVILKDGRTLDVAAQTAELACAPGVEAPVQVPSDVRENIQ